MVVSNDSLAQLPVIWCLKQYGTIWRIIENMEKEISGDGLSNCTSSNFFLIYFFTDKIISLKIHQGGVTHVEKEGQEQKLSNPRDKILMHDLIHKIKKCQMVLMKHLAPALWYQWPHVSIHQGIK